MIKRFPLLICAFISETLRDSNISTMKSFLVFGCFVLAAILHLTRTKNLFFYDLTESLNAILDGKLSVEDFALEYEFYYLNNQSNFYVFYAAGKT